MSDNGISSAMGARSAYPFLDSKQAAHYLGLSKRHLERMRSRGDGPPFRRHARCVRYHVDDLMAWSDLHCECRLGG